MHCIGLNQQQLSRFSHHWFWGLSENKHPGNETFYDMAMDLHQHPKKREQIIRQLTTVSSRWPIVQAIFWMLNIHGYRGNYYRFQSHTSWHFYQEKDRMLSKEEQLRSEQAGGFTFILNSLQANLPDMSRYYDAILPYIPRLPQLSWRNNLSERIPLPENRIGLELSSVHQCEDAPRVDVSKEVNTDTKAYFIITAPMFKALNTLGLHQPIGESLLFSELKTAYRHSLMQSHPDKTGMDSSAAFIAIKEAMTLILNQITKPSSKQATSSDDFMCQFKQRMAEMDEAIERERLVLCKIQKRNELYNVSVDAYMADVDEVKTGVAEIKTGVAEIKTGVAEIKSGVAEIKTGVATYCAKVTREKERLDATVREVEKIKIMRAEKRLRRVILEMGASYEAVDNPSLKQNHHRLFKAVLSDISKLAEEANNAPQSHQS